MPDVSRSDSQRSDTDSVRPRVSFNRDVHVKRIVNDSSGPLIVGALSSDGAGHLVPTPVRRERLGKLNRRQLAQEAAKVLNEVDSVDCISSKGSQPKKFFTLPTRRKQPRKNSDPIEEVNLLRRHSEELPSQITSRKPNTKPHLNIPKHANESEEAKKSNLKRSRSDVTGLKSGSLDEKLRRKAGNDIDKSENIKSKKPQLSPIIEVEQREDYFVQNTKNDFKKSNKTLEKKSAAKKKYDKSNKDNGVNEKKSENLNNKNVKPKKSKTAPEIIIIDVDKAEDITKKSKKSKGVSLKSKLKSLSFKKDRKNQNETKTDSKRVEKNPRKFENDTVDGAEPTDRLDKISEVPKSPKILEAIRTLEKNSHISKSPEMIHSSQQPVEKLPLTRGRKVDTMVKRLNSDKNFMPPKTNIMVTPSVTVQHNNNQPFSYTQPRDVSPERSGHRTKSPTSPVIYAQVVVNNGDPHNPNNSNKQTIHTSYGPKKPLQHSDSDEGLGYEESGFGRKYDQEKSYTHFGDVKYDSYKNNEKYEEEFPITPKFKTVEKYFGDFSYNEFSKSDKNIFVDSSARGRGDGMDSRRRESLTEIPIENTKFNSSVTNVNGKSDLSYRRDLLESRINSRKFGERVTTINRTSPELNSYSPKMERRYVSEKSSRYYRHGSSSPVDYKESYSLEATADRSNGLHRKATRNKTKIIDTNNFEYHDYNRNRYDNEPKSFESQGSDYRSSPENINTRKNFFIPKSESPKAFRTIHTNRYKRTEKISKERDHYKSNPEINYSYNDRDRFIDDTFHDSLRRHKNNESIHNEKYFDSIDERKDKFGDSGIENDFRRDSGENFRVIKPTPQTNRGKEFSNESEDEGFASSLLIASERQHTDDNTVNNSFKTLRREYDSDRDVKGYSVNKEDSYKHDNLMEYKHSSKHEYVHRERSIDDGSHFDPRIDKDLDKEKTLRRMDVKPPKPAKKTGLEKVKSLFSRDSTKKKKEKEEPLKMVKEETLRARYNEYKGSSEDVRRNTSRRDQHSENFQNYDYSNRRRLSTPSPSPVREPEPPRHDKETASWFKSLDSRLSRKKEKSTNHKDSEDERTKNSGVKNLRFFGDTDIESNDSVRFKTSRKFTPGLHSSKTSAHRTRSQSTRDLHNISEEFQDSDEKDTLKRNNNYKSLQNIAEPEKEKDIRGSKLSLKPPASPSKKISTKNREENRSRRRKNEVSSVESSTEGDSSQQSQRSVVYLHAATVGDIPGLGVLPKNTHRNASREELNSLGSSRMHSQTKTLSRSFSMLAPWKPRHPEETYDIYYTNYPTQTKQPKYSKTNGKSAKDKSNKKISENRKSTQNLSTLNRHSKSKENVSTLNRKKNESSRNSTSTLYKKKEKPIKENNRYTRDDKKLSNKSMSVESLGHGKLNKENHVSRSVSMPRDPEKSAGWFKMNKSNKKKTGSQRL